MCSGDLGLWLLYLDLNRGGHLNSLLFQWTLCKIKHKEFVYNLKYTKIKRKESKLYNLL